MDDNSFRAFVKDAKERANHFSGESYVAHDVRVVILDLLKICASYEATLNDSQGQSADSRILKKKYDAVKTELRASETRVEAVKKKAGDMIDFIIQLSPETSKMPADVGARVSTTVQKMAKAISEISKL